jgi:phosphoribosylformimino-5-aminoimidazole carboxamide ribotide isomerase
LVNALGMRVIGVLDLLAGRAVHARAGRRDSYQLVRAVAGLPIESGDALALARAYVDRLGVTELYAADLEAILGRASQDALVGAVAALGAPLWLDAGVSSTQRARHSLGLGAARVVVGLETLASYEALGEICAALDGGRVAFSLDLRDGEPVVVASGDIPLREPAHVVASRAANAGVGAVIVLDLARVGTGAGLDFALIARVRESTPGQMLLAGGGVRGYEDLARLADAGCDGALVATALHDGRLCAADVASAHRLGQGRPTR